ncbi:MAG: right-handed parallel beta-helix repeat-containing protein [Actinomycetota bacterium]|nr:right-handed parallel beta-helix repeat-containing protein [Actinomycetota bacterium]
MGWSRSLRFAPAAVALAFIAVVGACTGDDDDAEPAPDPSATASVPASTTTAAPTTTTAPPEPIVTLHVDDKADEDGAGTEDDPLPSVQEALDLAGPGTLIRIEPGTYHETLRTVRDGSPEAPIRLVGDDAKIDGDGGGRLVHIRHDHIRLENLDLGDAGIVVLVEGATDVQLRGNRVHDAAGECIRIRQESADVVVAANVVEGCGLSDFDLDDDEKNGEGIYVGTAPEQTDGERDGTARTVVVDNRIEAPAECVDVKEGAVDTLVEHNFCTGSQDPIGGGLSSRGIGTVFRANISTANDGSGIVLTGDTDADGTGTVVVDNVLVGNDGWGIKVVNGPQELLCGNRLTFNAEGPTTNRGRGAGDPCPAE